MSEIRLLIADDHAIARAGIRTFVEDEPDMTVVGEAADGDDALKQALEQTPDVVVLDITMPQSSGASTVRKIAQKLPRVRILVLTMHDDRELVRASLAAGAAGYVVKNLAGRELLNAIRTVHSGRTYVNVSLPGSHSETGLSSKPAPTRVPITVLSAREREVFELLVRGNTYQEIADQLYLSIKTIGSHRSHISKKLQLKTRADFMGYATELGLL